MLEFVTIIIVQLFDPPMVSQHPRSFKTVEACEKQLFEFYRSSGGELITHPIGDQLVYHVGGYYRYCQVIRIDEWDQNKIGELKLNK